ALLTGMPGLLGWLTVAGAGYLLWLGVATLRSWRGASFNAAGVDTGAPAPGQALAQPKGQRQAQAQANQFRTFLQGMGTSGINPKGLLFFVALVPQFVSPEAALPVPVQSGLLGLTFVLLVAVIYSCVALLARKLLKSRPVAARGVTLASGAIMLALGAVLLSEQLIPLLGAAVRHG
ncbi:MAG: LysE family translocator, partial [Arthrobacter sp.]|nr:LysE family translocator [Arthrobacter sp.]